MSSSDFSGNSDIEDIESTSWKLDLVSLLLDPSACTFENLRQLCQKRPVPPEYRKDVWRICLQISSTSVQKPQSEEFVGDTENGLLLAGTELHADCTELLQAMEADGDLNLLCAGDDKNRIQADLEYTLQCFMQTYNMKYSRGNGWLQMLRVLLPLKLPRDELYAFFVAIHHRYIIAGLDKSNRAFDVLRLLLQYHEPQLCAQLDTDKISLKDLTQAWFSSLFASSVPLDVLASMWDVYFLMAEPLLLFTLTLVIFMQAKEAILTEPGFHTLQDVKVALDRVCAALNVEDLEDFFVLADHFLLLNTPSSFQQNFTPLLFGNMVLDGEESASTQCLVLTLGLEEVLRCVETPSDDEAGRAPHLDLLLVDCRHADDYNAGHLPMAHYLDPDLLLRSPNEFHSSMKAILSMRREGQHLCFMGVDAADELVTMVVAQFLQRHVTQVSLLQGGYRGLHEGVSPTRLDTLLEGHARDKCLVCRIHVVKKTAEATSREAAPAVVTENSPRSPRSPRMASTNSTATRRPAADNRPQTTSPSMLSHAVASVTATKMSSMFNRLSATVMTKSAIVKEKVVNYVKNEAMLLQQDSQQDSSPDPGTASGSSSSGTKSPIQNAQKSGVNARPGGEGRAYRNTANVFSLDDEEEEVECSSDVIFNPRRMELVSLEAWRKKPDITHCFPCQLIRRVATTGRSSSSSTSNESSVAMPAHLLLSETRLFVLLDAATFPYHVVNAGSPPAEVKAKKGLAFVALRRPLKRLMKITSHRKLPELIGLHYGDVEQSSPDGEIVIQEKDRILFPTGCAGEATKDIKLLAYQAAAKKGEET